MVSSSFDFKIYQVGITSSAKKDLDIIYKFIEETTGSSYYADKRLRVIESEIYKLSIFPNGYPIYNEKHRIRHIKKYCILFKIDEKHNKVNIARIFHAWQNIDKRLNEQ